MRNQIGWLLSDWYYWLPRAKSRIRQLMPYGREYPVDSRWPEFVFDNDDIRGLCETERQLNALTPESCPTAFIIARVRLESHCKLMCRTLDKMKEDQHTKPSTPLTKRALYATIKRQ